MKLSDLTPEAVADEVVSWALSHLRTQLFRLGAVDVTLTDANCLDLRLSVRVLTHYAKTGEIPEDAPIAEYLQTVGEALWTAAHPDVFSMWVPFPWGDGAGEPTTAIDVVLCAVQCREQLAAESDVSVRELAALAGVSEKRLRNLAAAGEISMSEGHATAREAQRWLSGRGIEA